MFIIIINHIPSSGFTKNFKKNQSKNKQKKEAGMYYP